ncbi:PIG-L family deacetylase [Lihuaxuella thermophila]|uniref:GlcNAc-PI de-N-acetylase n=1 Tax=Lihuaxuella thermophila TaxID=1173111 RepID=A0A1H8I0I1_9BACL|nr:PIG-L family deacetylase [Lihuaxuella thermophila]SEN61721.1 GlcNAc-PI de-N-acetylase [Lihuaxuella thermophila]
MSLPKKGFLLCLSVALLLCLLPVAHSDAAILRPVDSGSNVVVYLVPHADDETLTFSVPVVNDIRAGKKVYMVLLSAGAGSSARETLNGKYDIESHDSDKAGEPKYCNWHKRYHDPILENYHVDWLTRYEFGQARIHEFYKAGIALGVPKARLKVHLLDQFTYDAVKAVIRTHARLFPNAEFKSMSRLDGHSEHAMLGRVLDDMYARKEIKKRQTNFISIYTDRFSGKIVPGYKIYPTHTTDRTKVIQALNVYKTWNPPAGDYAIGYHSVPAQFDSMLNQTYTKVSRY